MNLKDFFESEKSRVFAPDALFTKRVMARVHSVAPWKSGIWDIMPGSARPVLALAFVLILCFLAIELFVPQMPQRGVVESVFESEASPVENLLYNETDVPARQVVLQQLIAGEDEK
jgi:hypothetical protein